MEFRREIEVAKILVGGKLEESVVEIRYDPLTLQTSRIVRKSLSLLKSENFDDEIESSKSWCPFCEERIETIVSRDPVIMKGEIWRREEAVAFANLVPYSKLSLVVRITKDHYVRLSDLKEQHFFDAFKLLQDYINKLEGKFYVSIGMNYLKPAGSSIMHPHIQFLVSESSTDYFARLNWSSLEYFERNGTDFWKSLVDEEREGERYIGKTKKTEWVVAFAPKGLYHIVGIPEEMEFASMSDEQLEGFCEGIVKILKYYESKNLNAFNFTFFCGDNLGKHFRTNFHIVARTPFAKYYWCDVFFPKIFHDESVTFFVPEDYARELREIWQS